MPRMSLKLYSEKGEKMIDHILLVAIGIGVIVALVNFILVLIVDWIDYFSKGGNNEKT